MSAAVGAPRTWRWRLSELSVRWRASRRRLLELWIIGVLASVGVTVASLLGYLDAAQARSVDVLMRLRGVAPVADVVIVAIDDDAFAALGERQPLPRDYLARVIRGLRRSRAAVVGLDVDLSTPTSPTADRELVDAMTAFGDERLSRVVAVEPARLTTGPLAEAGLRGQVLVGTPDIAEDADGVIRRAPLAVRRGDRVMPAFALAVVARLHGAGPATLDSSLRQPEARLVLPTWRSGPATASSSSTALAVRPGELWRINFVGPARTFLTLPSDAIARLADESIPLAEDNPLRGRIVLVGGTFAESRDFYQTPHGRLAGVEIHANVIHMLGTRSFIRPSGWLLSLAIQVTLVLIAGLLLVLVNPVVGTIASLSGALLLGFPASYLVFERGHYSIDFMLPVLAMRVMAWSVDFLDRPGVRAALERYVGRRRHAPTADASVGRDERGGISVLSVVVRGFEGLRAEGVLPSEVASRIPALRAAMAGAVERHRGTLEAVGVGERARAVFAPAEGADHAARAVRAAAAIDEAVRALNDLWAAEGLGPLAVGMGVHTMGLPGAGTTGDSSAGAVPAAADIANEVEAVGNELGTTILITETTRRALGDSVNVLERGIVSAGDEHGKLAIYELLTLEP